MIVDIRSFRLLSILSLSAITFIGCGSSTDGPDRAPVSGRLTIDGKAIENVEVNFFNPDFPKHTGFGTTDGDGNFRLVQGAVPGKNTVFFSKLLVSKNASGLPDDIVNDSGQVEAMGLDTGGRQSSGIKQLVPIAFSTGASKLTVEVPDSGTDSANFDL